MSDTKNNLSIIAYKTPTKPTIKEQQKIKGLKFSILKTNKTQINRVLLKRKITFYI